MTRANGEDQWSATALTSGHILGIPEIGIEIPVAAFYDRTDLPEVATSL